MFSRKKDVHIAYSFFHAPRLINRREKFIASDVINYIHDNVKSQEIFLETSQEIFVNVINRIYRNARS